ncbi:MAG: tetratricopeptide repeat protein [Rubripirellula sp.]
MTALAARVLSFALLATFCLSLASAQDAPVQEKAADAPAKKSPDVPVANPGQSDLDEAVIQRIDAESNEQLEAVSALLESALTKGLDDENKSFAKKMLGSVLFQRSQRLAAGMVQTRGRRRAELQEEAMDGLREAVKNDPTLVEAYLLIARLNLLPGGSKDEITQATSRAIELLEEDPREQSAAYVLRAITRDNDDDKLADLDAAAKADPENLEAFQARAALRLQKNDIEGAMADLETVLMKDPTNQQVAGAAVQKLVDLNRVEDALKLTTKALSAKPSEGMYRMRAILYRSQNKLDEAMSDLNKAIAMKPKDPMTLLQRAEFALDRDDVKSAKEDLRAAIKAAPGIINADATISLRSQIALEEKRLPDAINDAKMLLDRNRDDLFRHLRLANLYTIDERPRKAIDVLTAALNVVPKNAMILRTRGDALLSVGDHAAAIDDYEESLKALGSLEKIEADERLKVEAAGAYNNLSWVLATSPVDSIRDGKRALELGETAAKLSEYKKAHILSTLAAAHAETGDFEKAIQWSTKAVEVGTAAVEEGADKETMQLDQLKKELKSYEKNKPWREKQETEENTVPILSPEDLIDT